MEDISKNLGKCFKQNIGFGIYVYYKIIQETVRYYKILRVSDTEIGIYHRFNEFKSEESCSTQEFDAMYDKVIKIITNKIID